MPDPETTQQVPRDDAERIGARALTAEVWRLVTEKVIDARSPAGDAALNMRDLIDPSWWPDVDEERPKWHPNLLSRSDALKRGPSA